MRIKLVLAAGALLALGACGDTLGEQALVGGAAGAGTALVTNGDPLTGAVIGGAGNVAFCQSFPDQCRGIRR